MNREIKFRVLDNEKKQFVSRNNVLLSLLEDHQLKDLNDSILLQKKYKLMQYTGLKDINGVEIYEGDIVKSMEFGGINFEIVWHNDNACFVGENNSIKGIVICLNETIKYPMYHLQFGKVIGNIYENPELLGEINQ